MVRLTEITVNTQNAVRNAIGTDDVILETANVTLTELKMLEQRYLTRVDQLMQQSQRNTQEQLIEQNLVGFGINEQTSKMFVKIYELDGEKLERLNRFLEMMIRFLKMPGDPN